MLKINADNVAGPESTRINTAYIDILFQSLSPWLDYNNYPVGHRFSFSSTRQSVCYFIRSGAISLYRQPDDVLIELIEAPTMRGIIPVHPQSVSVHTLRIIEPAEVAILEKERLNELLTELQLWEVFAKHLQLVASMASEVMFKLITPSVFDVVRLQLYELMNKPLHIREGISAESYVRGKTRVSRSAIMRVLADLKTGGYIIIENGILKEIRSIPARY